MVASIIFGQVNVDWAWAISGTIFVHANEGICFVEKCILQRDYDKLKTIIVGTGTESKNKNGDYKRGMMAVMLTIPTGYTEPPLSHWTYQEQHRFRPWRSMAMGGNCGWRRVVPMPPQFSHRQTIAPYLGIASWEAWHWIWYHLRKDPDNEDSDNEEW